MTQLEDKQKRNSNAKSFDKGRETTLLHDIAEHVLRKAQALGATQAEVGASSETGLSVTVRMGEVETVEFSRDRGVGVTVYFGTRKGSASTADLDTSSVDSATETACAMARFTQEDPAAGLADPDLLANQFPDLDLHHPDDWEAQWAIDRAISMEQAGRATDPRITNSDGTSVYRSESVSVYANSHGFRGDRAGTRFGGSCSLVAAEGGSMQRDYYYASARAMEDLASLEAIGQEAGKRAVSRLGARSIPTANVQVLYTPEMARSLFGHLISAVSGGNLYRKASFLLDALHESIFPEFVSIEEKPLEPRGYRSTSFDGEGVATRQRHIVHHGELNGYVLASYSARRLNMQSTGNSGGVHNLTVAPGTASQEDLIRQMGRGLVITELIGQGVNIVTGDYSRGAAGYWVENGEIVHPVEGVTVAGNLRQMFAEIQAIGSDLDLRANVRTPSVLMGTMTVAGS